MVALRPKICGLCSSLFSWVRTISSVGPRDSSPIKCISSEITRPISSIHSASRLIIESIFSFVKIKILFFSSFFSTLSKSPVEIPTFTLFPIESCSNFLNSINFSDANARSGLR